MVRGEAPVSPRESEVLQAIGEHLTNAQIAARLTVSVRTVESHVSALLRKLDATDRRELARIADTRASAEPTEAGPSAHVVGLPTQWTSFVGRTEERRATLDALAEARIVTLLGPGGMGKSRLAAEVAREYADSVSGGAWVTLVSVSERGLHRAVATALDVTEQPDRSLLDIIQADLTGRGPFLLVLDNCEHLTQAVTPLVVDLLGACPETTVLATSRERLDVPGERLSVLSPLPLEPDAVDLFHERADLGDADPAVVREICRRVDRMPLAIELAAARAASLGVDGVLDGIDSSLGFLSQQGRTERHRSLDAVLDWSHTLLDEDERRVLRALSIFVGSIDLAAFQAVAGGSGAATDVLGHLVDKSLVERTSAATGTRWQLLDTVRRYAREKLDGSGEIYQVTERHLHWAAELATDLDARMAAGEDWQAEFDLVVDDLGAALTAVPGAGPVGIAHDLARTLGDLLYARRFFRLAERRCREAASRATGPGQAADDLRQAAYVATADVRGDTASQLLLEAADAASRGGDGALRAICLSHAVTLTNRIPTTMREPLSPDRRAALLTDAQRALPDDHPTAAAYVAQAAAWNGAHDEPRAALKLADEAYQAAARADHAALMSSALDASCAPLLTLGDYRDAHRITQRRVPLLDRMPEHDPRNATEFIDTVHMVIDTGVAVGELADTIDHVRRFHGNDLMRSWVHYSASKSIVPLVLAGEFDRALPLGEAVWQGWLRADRPTARWLAAPAVAMAHLFALRREDEASATWLDHAFAFADTRALAERRNVAGLWAFVQLREALHSGDLDTAAALATAPQGHADGPFIYDAYLTALAAEAALVADLPDADERLRRAEAAADQNRWAAACLARARGRLSGDQATVAGAAAEFARIGARFDRASTLVLLPDHAAEGQAELDRILTPGPADDR